MIKFAWEWLMSFNPIRVYKFPWDNEYYKIKFRVPFTNREFVWSHYAKGWFNLRIIKE